AMASRRPPASTRAALSIAVAALAEHGYEPRSEGGRTVMANCPFHALAQTHTELVCHMNDALIHGLIDAIAPERLCAALEPGDNRCCVVLSTQRQDGPST